MKSVAIILARGGSKRIPRKNIRSFHGRPIIAYSIVAARASNLFGDIVVSTDSEEIAAVARAAGASVPALRPAHLSDDHTPMVTVLKHEIANVNAEYACCLMATAPFIRVQDLVTGYTLISSRKVSTVFSVTTFPFPIFRALKLGDDHKLSLFWPEYELTRSNDLPVAYHDAGQFYWMDVRRYVETGRMYNPDSEPVVLPRYLVHDIDTMEDWERAELVFSALTK